MTRETSIADSSVVREFATRLLRIGVKEIMMHHLRILKAGELCVQQWNKKLSSRIKLAPEIGTNLTRSFMIAID
jgi:hypothetical protein